MKRSDYPDLRWQRDTLGKPTTEVAIGFSAPVDDDGFELVEEALATFCTVGNLGGFCHQGASPGSSICRVVARDRSGTLVKFALECHGVDYRAFQVLRNMLAKLNEDGVRTRALSLSTPSIWVPEDPVAPIIHTFNEEQAYPPLHRDAPLSFGDEDEAFDAWFRRCVVSVGVSVEQAHVDALLSLARPWFDVVEAGGFALPLDLPWDVESVADTVTQFEDQSIEVTVMRFQASEEAWSTLANLIWMNDQALGLGVRRIVVDD